ncbi:GNAT family N-acetyltransferase [Bradyrhizobium diazoefficiens]|uniref:GNAT family N-acetyltransferase n=1 Tax=Bradyrhizobium diazoefficiens TaxID=1355477 RepID=UPI00272CFFCD|nr:phosphopantetheine-binding protein [Bradyrhizobium diazoefficiens]WLA67647.1 GNAT family N-acetyltransferase [Bradyrhizobium diazoefficiens]
MRGQLFLLVVLREGLMLDDVLAKHIRSELARCGSAAFVPARIAQVDAVPVTFNGKRSEAAARDAVNGRPVRNRDALLNPKCLDAIAKHPVLRSPPAAIEASPRLAVGGGISTDNQMRHELQAICERVLGVPAIGWSDDLLGFGADSLALVNLLLEIESYAGRRVPLSVLLAVPSIEGLATALFVGDETMTVQYLGQSGPHVRAMTPDDREPICRFLEDSFRQSGIDAATWRQLFDHQWSDHGRGFILLDGNAVVGFIGAITARREVNGKAVLVCNLSSWVVRAQYRGWGLALLASVLQDESVTYTSFTPGPITWPTLMARGFKPLGAHRIAMPPLLQSATLFGPNRPLISFDPAVVRERLTSQQRQIFDDHSPYDCLQLTVTDGSDSAYLVVKRRVHRVAANRLGRRTRVPPFGIPYSDILHCSSPEVLSRHLERVKLAILRRQRTAALVADARLFKARPWGMTLSQRTCYRSPLLEADDVDGLYSEIVLLPM